MQLYWSLVELITKLNYIADTLLENDYDLEALWNKNEISNSIWEDLGFKGGALLKL